MALTRPLKNNEVEEFEEPLDPHVDEVAGHGFFPQNSTSMDLAVGLERDASGNLTLKDGFAGTVTLSSLIGGSGVSNYDFLLDNEPDAVGTDYAITRSLGKVSQESWTNTSTSALIKTIDYTRTLGLVTTEVRKVYDSLGTTVVAQLTVVYTRSLGHMASAVYTRDI